MMFEYFNNDSSFSLREAERVMVCVLPQGKSRDAATRIQHTLIEAFCRENDVRCLKVSVLSNYCPLQIFR